jgi:hypothetical protein
MRPKEILDDRGCLPEKRLRSDAPFDLGPIPYSYKKIPYQLPHPVFHHIPMNHYGIGVIAFNFLRFCIGCLKKTSSSRRSDDQDFSRFKRNHISLFVVPYSL